MLSRFAIGGSEGVATIFLSVVGIGDTLDLGTILQPGALLNRANGVHENRLSLAAHNGIDPGCFGKHLLIHERGVDAAEKRHRAGVGFLRDLQQPLGLVD